MSTLEVSGLSKSFGNVKAVDQVTFTADQGELIGLLGPSGCGKTTLLRLLSGIEDPDTGTITFGGIPLNNTPIHHRGFGLMFQDLALFPHMDVFSNIAFGLRMKRLPSPKVQERVQELLELVGMTAYSHRKVHQLSGGERQRVALARSLAPAPKLLMLDEPLGSLDRALRDNLQTQVRRILKEVGVTSIYVTHDRDEAFAMADRLAFMNQGKFVQTGTPEEVVANPADEFVGRSLGFKNILHGTVIRHEERIEIECSLGVLHVQPQWDFNPIPGSRAALLIDERGIKLFSASADKIADTNTFEGIVTEKIFRGTGYELKIRTEESELSCYTSPDQTGDGFPSGSQVRLVVDPRAVKFLTGTSSIS